MKRIYLYLLVCLFGLQTVVAAEEGTAYDIRLHGGLT